MNISQILRQATFFACCFAISQNGYAEEVSDSVDTFNNQTVTADSVVVQGRTLLTSQNVIVTNTGHLTLNGKPLVQGEYPACPTCSAMLARGYGIENINAPELAAVRDKINGEYTDISNAVDNISPILGLLKDGYYVVADAVVYPTSGDRHFFCNVPDKLSETEAACTEYYDHIFYEVTDGYPAYLYPSQSNNCLNKSRAKEYLPVIIPQEKHCEKNHKAQSCP